MIRYAQRALARHDPRHVKPYGRATFLTPLSRFENKPGSVLVKHNYQVKELPSTWFQRACRSMQLTMSTNLARTSRTSKANTSPI